MKHTIWHVLGCVLPLLAIFLLPLLGLGGGITLFLGIVLLFACHLFMIRGHGHGADTAQPTRGGHSHEHH